MYAIHTLMGKLLAFLQQEGKDTLVEQFFEQFWEERFRDAEYHLSKLDPGDQEGRLEVLQGLLREQGFMPEIRQDENGLIIRECTDAHRSRTRLLCRPEAAFFEHIFDERIGRVAYIPDGSTACTYEFSYSLD